MLNRIQSLFQRYPSFDKYSWLQSSKNWRFLLAATVLIMVAGLVNYDTRQNQWKTWTENPDVFFTNGTSLVSTTDAGYFLSLADDYRRGGEAPNFDQHRLYPDKTDAYLRANNPDYSGPDDAGLSATDVPMLSAIIAFTGDMFFDGDLIKAGNLMLPISALLTAFALGAMFWAVGFPAEGAIVGTGVGLSTTYLMRTSIGRIDTDQLIVFFLAISLTFMFLAASQRNLSRQLGFVLLSALASLAFQWWYSQALFIVLLPLLAGVAIYCSQLDLKRASIGTGVYILATNPLVFFPAIWTFIEQVFSRVFGISLEEKSTSSTVNLSFPDTFSTITEQSKINLFQTLEFMTSDARIGAVGLIGFIIFIIVKPSRGLVFLPFFMIGILSVYLGRRFAFYGAPFIWFGVAWLTLSIARLAADKFITKTKPTSFAKDGVVLAVALATLLTTASISFLRYVPQPSFSAPVVKSFADMKHISNNGDGIMATWWDYGYLSHFKNRMSVLHDGGTQTTPRTFLIARAMVGPNQHQLTQILKFISTEGSVGIEKNAASGQALGKAILGAGMPDKPLYIMVTDQMGAWITTMAKLGLHDTVNNLSPSNSVLNGFGYRSLRCEFLSIDKFECRNGLLDLAHGTLNGKPIFNATVHTLDGKIIKQKQHDNNGLFVLLVGRLSNGGYKLTMVPQPTWNSSFNQLFELGVYDETQLELVLDNFPAARVYKVLR